MAAPPCGSSHSLPLMQTPLAPPLYPRSDFRALLPHLSLSSPLHPPRVSHHRVWKCVCMCVTPIELLLEVRIKIQGVFSLVSVPRYLLHSSWK